MTADKPKDSLEGRLFEGCLVAIFVCIAFVGSIPALLTAGCVVTYELAQLPYGHLPERLNATGIYFKLEPTGVLESCEYGFYRLAPNSIAALRQDGLGFLAHDMVPADNNPDNPYDPWHATPLLLQRDVDGKVRSLFALYSDSGYCHESDDAPVPQEVNDFDVEKALSKPGSYYTVTANGEGMIVLDPIEGVAVVMYNG